MSYSRAAEVREARAKNRVEAVPLDIYERGIRKRASLERLTKEIKREEETKQLEGVTFAPRTNSKKNVRLAGKPEERLIEHVRIAMQKQEKIATEVYMTDRAKCTFVPHINTAHHSYGDQCHPSGSKAKKTKTEAESDSKPRNRFEMLYVDSQRKVGYMRSLAKQHSDQECTFRPSINKPKKTARVSLIERSAEKARHMAQQRQSESENRPMRTMSVSSQEIDPETGKQLFVPSVGRAPKNRGRGNQPIGNYLYSQVKANAELLNSKRMLHEIENRKESNIVMTQERSNQIVARLRVQSFHRVFELMDSDHDGKINADAISVDGTFAA